MWRYRTNISNMWSSLFVLLCLGYVSCVPLRLFYPYGESRGDGVLQGADDISSSEIQLAVPIHYYDGFYTSIFVNSNGHLSFGSEFPGYQPNLVIPMGYGVKLIAAFMSDIDLSLGGNVFYRESKEEPIMQRVAADIQSHFSQFPSFEPLGLFIATWDGVVGFNKTSTEQNTFQIVIASDELNSFVIFNYLDDGLEWTTGSGKVGGRPDPPGQAGFDSGNGRLHLKLPNSGTNEVYLLASESNVNLDGVWMFHVGDTKGGNVQGPDLNTGDVEIFEPEVGAQTCVEGSRSCSPNARCVDFTDGFCCECMPAFFGNGKHCIQPDQPQRLNGKVSGIVNGVEFENLEMHAFVVTKDGRAYTAVSRVPMEISTEVMTLNTIGGVIGWMFALKSGPNAMNGFMYTGGSFNRTARITYRAGGQVVINQRFYGHDTLNNIRMDTFINGTIPAMETTEKITVDDYKEEYKKIQPGVIRSQSDRTFHVNNVTQKYSWDQTIVYDECTNDPNRPGSDTMRLGVTRNYVIYDTNNRIVRFAMSNKISVLTGYDPCREGANTCDPDAECIPGGDSFTCECRTGFYGDGFSCTDLDECTAGLNTCDENAVCYNSPGSFQCQCKQGYRGDGRTCILDVAMCGSDVCDEYSRCVFDTDRQQAFCQCVEGYSNPDGRGCRPITFQCNEADICHENAECLFNIYTQRYECECVEGFSGDGLYCTSDAIVQCTEQCDPNAECLLDVTRMAYRCLCKAGYTGDGRYCSVITDDTCARCDPNAQCIEHGGQMHCRCAAGYRGNGYQCEAIDCRVGSMCDSNARCTQDSEGGYYCRCNPGFRGNGQTCESEGCQALDNCDTNARCVSDPRDTSRSMCRCNPGFSGNGFVCIRRVASCAQVDNCSEYGECVYDPEVEDHKCRCHNGYEGDGITCTPRGVDCRRQPDLCDPNASCMLNVDNFICVCNAKYRGDGTSCTAASDEMNYLLFSRGYSIHKVPYKQNGLDTDGTRVLYVPDELAIGVATDCADQTFYWTDVSGGKISRATQDGFSKEVVTSGFSSPEGIAIDWLSRNIYVTDSALDIVAVMNINGTFRKTLVSDNLVNPRAIILDPQRGVMYWTDWYRENPTIEQANMDGTDRKVFVETDLALPNGLTMDYYTQQICWGDAGMNRIECIRSDGVGRRVITDDAAYPFDTALYGNTIYWSDWTINGVPSIDRNNGEAQDELKLPVGGNGRLYGITAVGEFCPRVTNACYRSYNGGCTYLCLPTPNGGRTCACPDDVDDETCAETGQTKRK